jgi:AcrR family transcriptional regulator
MRESVRQPKQKRSQASLERVLVASIELLEEKGFDAFTIQDVSQRADVSVGAIYARFGSKQSLVRAVQRHAMELELNPEHVSFENHDGRPAREVVTAAVRSIAEMFHASEDLVRAFMHLGAVDGEISKRASDHSKILARRFTDAILVRRGEITHGDPDKAVDVAFRMAFSTFARRVMSGPTHESDRLISWDELADEVGVACAAYLLGGESPKRRRSAR